MAAPHLPGPRPVLAPAAAGSDEHGYRPGRGAMAASSAARPRPATPSAPPRAGDAPQTRRPLVPGRPQPDRPTGRALTVLELSDQDQPHPSGNRPPAQHRARCPAGSFSPSRRETAPGQLPSEHVCAGPPPPSGTPTVPPPARIAPRQRRTPHRPDPEPPRERQRSVHSAALCQQMPQPHPRRVGDVPGCPRVMPWRAGSVESGRALRGRSAQLGSLPDCCISARIRSARWCGSPVARRGRRCGSWPCAPSLVAVASGLVSPRLV